MGGGVQEGGATQWEQAMTTVFMILSVCVAFVAGLGAGVVIARTDWVRDDRPSADAQERFVERKLQLQRRYGARS